MCPNDHDPTLIEVRPNGARVCTGCRDQYQHRNRISGRGTGTVPNHSAVNRRDAREATNHDRVTRS